NKAEQHGRFHTIDLFPVEVRLVGEVGHGNSPCNTLSNPCVTKLSCDLHWGCDRGNTEKSHAARLTRAHAQRLVEAMSVLPSKADMDQHSRDDRLVPKADI